MNIKSKIIEEYNKIADASRKPGMYWCIYSILFLLMSCIVFVWFIVPGRTLIWHHDGLAQHYKALLYYGNYMQTIIKNLIFNHQLLIPSWDFSIGEGSDIFQNFSYYVIGDPFALFSVFFPAEEMYICFNFIIILRLYFAGIAFSALCFESKVESRYGILAGSFCYIFCLWALINACRHPYFLNPMIYFPLIIIGLERIFKNKRPYIYIVSILISAVSNFYFFYVLALLTVVYVIVRIISIYGFNLKKLVQWIFKVFLFTIPGLIMAMAVLLPSLYLFLGDARISAGNAIHLFYPYKYYSMLPSLFITQGDFDWLAMGYAAPALIAVFFLFTQKERRFLKVLLVIGFVFMFFPIFGQAFNAFSYMANRWCFGFSLLVSYILASCWPKMQEPDKKSIVNIFVMLSIYIIVCLLLEESRNVQTFSAITLAGMFLIAVILYGKDTETSFQKKELILLVITLVSICTGSFWKYSEYAKEATTISEIQNELTANETAAVEAVANLENTNSFYRYSGQDLTLNAGMLRKLSGTQFYWSLSNPYAAKFRAECESIENSAYKYEGYADNAILNTLAAVKYYVVPKGDKVSMYGYNYVTTVNAMQPHTDKLIEEIKKELGVDELTPDQLTIANKDTAEEFDVYRNDNFLPLAYAYDSVIDKNDWLKLDAAKKQEALLYAASLSDYDGDVKGFDSDLKSKDLPYELVCNGYQVSLEDNSFVVTSGNASATLIFEGIPNSETYLNIQGLNVEPSSKLDLYFDDEADPLDLYNDANWNTKTFSQKIKMMSSKLFYEDEGRIVFWLDTSNGTKKSFEHWTPDYDYYNNRHDYAINLGYSEEPITAVSITFPEPGTYSFSDIKVLALPMEDYYSRVNELKEGNISEVMISTDAVECNTSYDEDKLLCFAIPFNKGWSAYVDGVETKLYETNTQYMGIDLKKGEHNIVLRYHTPLLKPGILISVISIILFIALSLVFERYKRRKELTK